MLLFLSNNYEANQLDCCPSKLCLNEVIVNNPNYQAKVIKPNLKVDNCYSPTNW